MKDISLLILAAGMGSRYGGLKQLDPLGPNDETILDFSVYDAIQAGFTKVVFVVRDFFLEDFKEKVSSKFEDRIEVVHVLQPVNVEIEGIPNIPHREKPWGTNHAILVAKDVINEPFAVINSDDYYGQSGFKIMAEFLRNKVCFEHQGLVGYELKNTLSDRGTVNRGVCTAVNSYLSGVEETLKIAREDNGQVFGDTMKGRVELDENCVVSMNFWGFDNDIFDYLEKGFFDFVQKNKENTKAEYFIPLTVDELIRTKKSKFEVLVSEDQWYGVTYKEDAEMVRSALLHLSEEGRYPIPLWS